MRGCKSLSYSYVKIEIKTFDALPCETEVFKVNNIKADVEDFGEVNTEPAGSYTCSISFEAKMPKQDVLDKYKIDLEEYEEITNKLGDVFCRGICSWCV